MPYSKYIIENSTMTNMANAVRNLVEKNQAFTPAQMMSEINGVNKDDYVIPPFKYAKSTLTTYSNDLTKIVGEFAFKSCYSLSQVSFPECKIINASAFQYCSSLTQATIPKCEWIGEFAFQYCRTISQITLIKCKYINRYAFNSCINLMSLYLNQASEMVQAPTSNATASDLFYNTPIMNGSGYIYVPASLETAYKNDSSWSTISSKIIGI